MCWKGQGEKEDRKPIFSARCEGEMSVACVRRAKMCEGGKARREAALVALDAKSGSGREGAV